MDGRKTNRKLGEDIYKVQYRALVNHDKALEL